MARIRASLSGSGGGGGDFYALLSTPDEFFTYLGAVTQTYTLQQLPKLIIYHATGGGTGTSVLIFVDPQTQAGLKYETINTSPYLKDPVATDQTSSSAVGPINISASSVSMKAWSSGSNPRQEMLVYY